MSNKNQKSTFVYFISNKTIILNIHGIMLRKSMRLTPHVSGVMHHPYGIKRLASRLLLNTERIYISCKECD